MPDAARVTLSFFPPEISNASTALNKNPHDYEFKRLKQHPGAGGEANAATWPGRLAQTMKRCQGENRTAAGGSDSKFGLR
jgi:hypothetical protein